MNGTPPLHRYGRRMRKPSLPKLLMAAALLVGGCTVGPDFLRPKAPDVSGYTPEPMAEKTTSAPVAAGEAQSFAIGRDLPYEWWTLFRSEPLNRLVSDALKANPDVQAAEAALRQARENYYAEQGGLYPQVNANVTAQRQRFSGASLGRAGGPTTFNLYQPSVDVSYGVDVFGGERRLIEARAAQAENQAFQLEAAYLNLSSNVVGLAIQEASLREQISATEDIVRAQSDQLDVVRRQFEFGGVSRADVLAQEAQVAQTRATLPPLAKQLAQTRNQLTTLAGRYPSQNLDQTFHFTDLTLPQELPLSVPSRLVEQRPDVRASEALLHAASAQIGVATANQLPQLTLTASVGSAATQIDNLFKSQSLIWSIGAGAVQPIFHGGTLEHEKKAAIAAFDQAAAQYRSAVLTSFQDVANALHALQNDADALAAQAEAERSAADSLTLARDQFNAGAISYLTLLNADRTYQQARISRVQAEAARYADTVALFQALGGGWWNRNDAVASQR